MSETTIPPVADQRGELIGRLKAKLKEYATRLKDVEGERNAAIQERDAATTKALKAQQDYDAEPLKTEVDRLKGTLRERDHRTVFDRLARSKGVAEDALDLVYQTSGYKAEGDAADEAAIGGLLDDLKTRPGVSRLFGESSVEPERRPAPANGQGGRVSHGNRIKATSDQVRDPDWCWRNRDALREKRVDLID